MSAYPIGAFKKVANTAIYRLALLEMTRQVMTRHFERIYFDENFEQSSDTVKRYHSKTK